MKDTTMDDRIIAALVGVFLAVLIAYLLVRLV